MQNQNVTCVHFLACFKKILLAPARAGWSENDITVPRSVSPPWKAFPDHTAQIDTPFWFLHPLRFSPSMNTENKVLGDAYFLYAPWATQPSYVSSLHQRPRISLLFYIHIQRQENPLTRLDYVSEATEVKERQKLLHLEQPTMCCY